MPVIGYVNDAPSFVSEQCLLRAAALPLQHEHVARQVLTMSSDAPKPDSEEVQKGKGKTMIVKVEACSLSRGDSIMLEGSCDLVRDGKGVQLVWSLVLCGGMQHFSRLAGLG